MARAPISDKFAKFAAKTTRGDFDKARKQESMASSCPLPIGTSGVAIVGEITCSETRVKQDGTGENPMVSIKLEVETPEEYLGKVLSGPGLLFTIKDGPKSTAADAWARMLDALESLGLPREIRTDYEDFSEVIDWFIESPRRVDYTVNQDAYTGNRSGKIVAARTHFDEAAVPTAATSPKEKPSEDPGADYAMYLGKRHKIVSYDSENKLYTLEMVSTGRIREGVEADKVDLMD